MAVGRLLQAPFPVLACPQAGKDAEEAGRLRARTEKHEAGLGRVVLGDGKPVGVVTGDLEFARVDDQTRGLVAPDRQENGNLRTCELPHVAATSRNVLLFAPESGEQ